MVTQALMSCRQPAGYTSLDGGRHTPGPGWCVCCCDWHEMHEVHGGRPGEEDEDGCVRWGDLHHCRSVTLQLFNNRLVLFQVLVLLHAYVVIFLFFFFLVDCLLLNSKHGIAFPLCAGLAALVATSWYGNRVARAFYDPFTPVNTRY